MQIIALEVWLVVLALMPKNGQTHIGDAPEAQEKNRAEELHRHVKLCSVKVREMLQHTIVL